MKSRLLLSVLLLVALQPKLAPANVVWVPEQWNTIQLGIEHASTGDTVSVWVHTVPPDTYRENIDFGFRSITVVNRSYIPNQVGYDSSWDHVVIYATQNGPVVAMTGSDSTVLKGFTIQNGFSYTSGGGVNCGKGHILKNHIRNNYTASRGGGVFYFTDPETA